MSSDLDRVAPTRRPGGPVRGYQEWRQLGFFHWTVPPAAIACVLPKGLDVDAFDGVAYIGVVPFAMQAVRPAWVPRRLGFDFLETNVRTYVHVAGRDPGVYFLSLDAASRVAVAAARFGWSLPYFNAAMTLTRRGDIIEYCVDRRSDSRPRLRTTWEVGEALGASKPGSLEHFLVERYFLHVTHRGVLHTGQVHHVPYPVRRARVVSIEDELVAASGLSVSGAPTLAHYAEGVDVEIFDLSPRS